MSFSIESEGETKDKASENACRQAFAHLMMTNASQVVLRPKHWIIPIEDVVAGLPIPSGLHQALPVHFRRMTAEANAMGATLEPHERDRLAAELVRQCLTAHGGSFDPAWIDHKAMGLKKNDERTYAKFNKLFEEEKDELKGFIESSTEFEWHREGRNGMRVTWASTVPSRNAPGSASEGLDGPSRNAPGSASELRDGSFRNAPGCASTDDAGRTDAAAEPEPDATAVTSCYEICD